MASSSTRHLNSRSQRRAAAVLWVFIIAAVLVGTVVSLTADGQDEEFVPRLADTSAPAVGGQYDVEFDASRAGSDMAQIEKRMRYYQARAELSVAAQAYVDLAMDATGSDPEKLNRLVEPGTEKLVELGRTGTKRMAPLDFRHARVTGARVESGALVVEVSNEEMSLTSGVTVDLPTIFTSGMKIADAGALAEFAYVSAERINGQLAASTKRADIQRDLIGWGQGLGVGVNLQFAKDGSYQLVVAKAQLGELHVDSKQLKDVFGTILDPAGLGR